MLFAAFAANAQVSIGGKKSVEGNSTLLDFNSDASGNKVEGTGTNTFGIIVPAVEDLTKVLADAPENNHGTFLFDKNDSKMKMYEDGIWKNLGEAGDKTKLVSNTSAEQTSQHGTIIGSPTSDAKGALILESSNKAMILPRIANPHLTVKSPYAGMMCYDTVSKSLAVFDGANWNYWK